jgi:hypothetical protein
VNTLRKDSLWSSPTPLVHWATRNSFRLILTIDRDDFEAYRMGGRRDYSGRTAK